MLTDFQNSFAARLSCKFSTNSYLNIPPHLKCVVTLPYKISMFKNHHDQEAIEANERGRLSHSKNCFNKICLVKYPLVNSLTQTCSH